MTDETYNGWANRETWAFNLHLSNDEGLWNHVLDMVDLYRSEGKVSDTWIGEAIVEHVQEDLPEMSPQLWELMRGDVGSFWRIDVTETGRHLLDALDEMQH